MNYFDKNKQTKTKKKKKSTFLSITAGLLNTVLLLNGICCPSGTVSTEPVEETEERPRHKHTRNQRQTVYNK